MSGTSARRGVRLAGGTRPPSVDIPIPEGPVPSPRPTPKKSASCIPSGIQEQLDLNFVYADKPFGNVPNGYNDRLEKRRNEAKLRRALHRDSKPVVFGVRQTRIEVFPYKKTLGRMPGTSDWGNGLVVGHRPDSMWGKKQDFPDDLDIAGQFHLPAATETIKEHLYMDVPVPNKATLWVRTKEPKSAPLPEKEYKDHILRRMDPYDVGLHKVEAWKTRGSIEKDKRMTSSGFADRKARVDISFQTGFEAVYSRTSTRHTAAAGARPKPCSSLERDRVIRNSLELQRHDNSSAWHRNMGTIAREERFNHIVGSDEFKATCRGNLSEGPPCTALDPKDPIRVSVSIEAAPNPSSRPGHRGGLYRSNTNGTFAFMSETKRMKPPKTWSKEGVGPHSYADGPLRNSMANRVQSARPQKSTPHAEPSVWDDVFGPLDANPQRSKSARPARAKIAEKAAQGEQQSQVGSRLVTDMLLHSWREKF